MPERVPGLRRPTGRVRRIIVIALVLILAAAGTLFAIETLRVTEDVAEQSGLAEFYEQPVDALSGEPGTLIKSEELAGTPAASKAWRIMYRSLDVMGNPIAVTGVVITPLGDVPRGERTVLAWGHPTTGTALDCAPSRALDPFIGIEGLRMMLDRGYTVVATDYVGMGTTGQNQYLVGKTAGQTVLDSIRAAQQLPEAQAGDNAVLWGHSQGGQAVLFAAELAENYAPELTIKAVAAAAPAADLTALMHTHVNDVSGVTLGSYAFSAYESVYSPAVQGAELNTVLSPDAIALLPKMNALCLLPNLSELHTMATPLIGKFFLHDPTTIEPWAGLLDENSAGRSPIKVPVFIAQGLSDTLVLPSDTEAFIAQLKSVGTSATYTTIPDATHSTIAYAALFPLESWLDEHVR